MSLSTERLSVKKKCKFNIVRFWRFLCRSGL